jgi:hypothetical protein
MKEMQKSLASQMSEMQDMFVKKLKKIKLKNKQLFTKVFE